MPTNLHIRRSPSAAALRAVILALAVAGFLAVSSGQALASHVSCGDTITTDTKLDSDLTGCHGDGVVIGADGITLDLAGHRIEGDAVPAGGNETDVGVDSGQGHDGVTVKNGAIRKFDVGASMPEASDVKVRELRVSRNGILGMDLDLSEGSIIEKSSFSDNGLSANGPGLFLFQANHTRLEGNSFTRNGAAGLVLIESSANRVERNWASRNLDGGMFFGQSDRNRIAENHVFRNAFGAIAVEADDNLVTRNRVFRNDDGIIVTGDRNTIVRNDVRDAVGCADGCGVGISLEGGTRNLVTLNAVARARVAGIRVASFPPDTPPTVTNVVRRNRVRGAQDGLLVESSATDTLLEDNLALRSLDDGIEVDSQATTLRRNTANHNHDLGIEAVPGVTDGGGNKARGNGNPLQCTNVVCN